MSVGYESAVRGHESEESAGQQRAGSIAVLRRGVGVGAAAAGERLVNRKQSSKTGEPPRASASLQRSPPQISSAMICARSCSMRLFMKCTLWMASSDASSGSLAFARWCRYARLQGWGGEQGGGERHTFVNGCVGEWRSE